MHRNKVKPRSGDSSAALAPSRLWQHDVSRCESLAAADGTAIGAGGNRCGVLGIDEAGRGSWVGPVVAAAAFLTPQAYWDKALIDCAPLIDDSKKLTAQRRADIYTRLCQWQERGLIRIAAGRAEVEEIEAHNVVGATALAMQRAVAALQLPFALPQGPGVKVGGKRSRTSAVTTATAISAASASVAAQCSASAAGSGTKATRQTQLELPVTAAVTETDAKATSIADTREIQSTREIQDIQGIQGACDTSDAPNAEDTTPTPFVWIDGLPLTGRVPWTHEGIVSGDATSLAIAMASIYAKVTRDRLLAQLGQSFPQYRWAENCGYGTPAHQAALREHGRCCHHRPKFLRKQGF